MEPAVVVSALVPPVVRVPGAGPRLLCPADVGGRVAWDLLLRDGALRLVTDGVAVPARTPVTPAVRAAVLTDRVGPRCVVVLRTAVWVWSGGLLDDDLDVAYRSGAHRVGAESVDLGVRVTTRERTVLDVASRLTHDEAVDAVVALAGAGADLRGASLLLEHRNRLVGRPAARAVLRAARDRVAAARPAA